jgi:hypothetical protein
MTSADVAAALADRTIIRTWPMRGTIHLIPAQDARWMLETTGKLALRGVEKRWQYLGLDRQTVARSADVLEQALAGGPLRRQEALCAIAAAGIDVSGPRGYHLLWYAAQTGRSCIGPNEGKEQTFVALSDCGPQRELEADEAYVELARRYFRSHGPATMSDFARWSGSPVTPIRAALATLADELIEIEVADQKCFVAADVLDTPTPTGVEGVLLLPGFDEFILGYRDRTLVLDAANADRIVPGSNGVFRPTVVQDGEVVGVWQRNLRTRDVDVTVELFGTIPPAVMAEIDARIGEYGAFLGLTAARK